MSLRHGSFNGCLVVSALSPWDLGAEVLQAGCCIVYSAERGSALGHRFESFGFLEGYCHALCFEPKCVTRLGWASAAGRAGAAVQSKPVWRLVRFRGAELNLTALGRPQSHLGKYGEAAPETRPVVSGGVCDKGFSMVWPRAQARRWGRRPGAHWSLPSASFHRQAPLAAAALGLFLEKFFFQLCRWFAVSRFTNPGGIW